MLFRSLLAAQSMICRGMCSFGNLVRHSGIKPESAIIAALHIELMARYLLGVVAGCFFTTPRIPWDQLPSANIASFLL